MINLLFELTLRGSIATIFVILLDRSFAYRISARSRRLWWIVVPFAFLVPADITVYSRHFHMPSAAVPDIRAKVAFKNTTVFVADSSPVNTNVVVGIWLIGVITYISIVLFRTALASRRWTRERLSTDRVLLELLEDCKLDAGVTAPIGVVVSTAVLSPAIMGWLRPRILLPPSLTTDASIKDLKPILLHELAHFRWFDIPYNWLLTVVRAVHWYNPFAHLIAHFWMRFREEAADETAIRWMKEDSIHEYGSALVRSLHQVEAATPPMGAFSVVESIDHLKRRTAMISRYGDKSPNALVVGFFSILLSVTVCSISTSASEFSSEDPKASGESAIQTWLDQIDSARYDQAWENTSTRFKQEVSNKRWDESIGNLRTALGSCDKRKRASLLFQKSVPMKNGPPLDMVVSQFETSYANQKYSIETVTVSRDVDGSWRGQGYFVNPR